MSVEHQRDALPRDPGQLPEAQLLHQRPTWRVTTPRRLEAQCPQRQLRQYRVLHRHVMQVQLFAQQLPDRRLHHESADTDRRRLLGGGVLDHHRQRKELPPHLAQVHRHAQAGLGLRFESGSQFVVAGHPPCKGERQRHRERQHPDQTFRGHDQPVRSAIGPL
jgi:hypothetical protein